MRRATATVVVLAALAAAGSGGYLAGRHNTSVQLSNKVDSAPVQVGKVIYYQDPDGKPEYSAEPKQTADGRLYVAVREDGDVNEQPKPATGAPSGKRILYYRNPMGLPDISKTPKKDPMGMDYIAVHEGEETDSSTVKVAPGKLQRIGVKSEPVARRAIAMPIRAPGTIQLDERRISVISLRSEAFVDTVEDVTTGSEVRKGQPLVRVYSQAISSAAADYATSLGFSGTSATPQGLRQRLLNLSESPQLADEIQRTRQVPVNFTWSSPRTGIVLERNVSDGMRVMPGDVLFRIADHSVVWAAVDVAERDLAAVANGQTVGIRVRSYPDKSFAGKVALIYPHLNPATRTVRVRVELTNTDLVLRPDMYAEAEINTGSGQEVLAVPDSAVIDSGDRQIVIIDKGDGRFEPRNVQLGRQGGGYVEIIDGVSEGDAVVTSANFLIDAESNLKAALKGLGAPQ